MFLPSLLCSRFHLMRLLSNHRGQAHCPQATAPSSELASPLYELSTFPALFFFFLFCLNLTVCPCSASVMFPSMLIFRQQSSSRVQELHTDYLNLIFDVRPNHAGLGFLIIHPPLGFPRLFLLGIWRPSPPPPFFPLFSRTWQLGDTFSPECFVEECRST